MTETIRVELHCHSVQSDGDRWPAQVARELADVGVTCAALTDHNTLGGQELFREALEDTGVRVITGLEIDARSPHGVLHLLAYGFDPQNQALLRTLQILRHPMRADVLRWIRKALPPDGRPVPSRKASSSAGARLAPPLPPGTSDAIRLIHEAGGLVFLAHPLASIGTVERLDAVLDWLQPQGLDGLEAFHKVYSRETQRRLASLAESRHLLVVAGSDFHGPYHSDGTSPGVDMPVEHWNRFAQAMNMGPPAIFGSSAARDLSLSRGHVGNY